MKWKMNYLFCKVNAYLSVYIIFYLLSFCLGDFNSLEENLVFKINWPGSEISLADSVDNANDNTIFMTTVENERYKCVVPVQILQNDGGDKTYTGPSPIELLQPLFSNNLCIFKLEQYWGYELCHGKHLRQFHEEKETGKQATVQEYFLGRYNNNLWKKDVMKYVEEFDASKIPHIKVDGQKIPYLEIVMFDGTSCDLNGKPRQTKVKYACSPEIKHQIYSLEESSTCEYEVLVLTLYLCAHPNFNLQVPKTNEIHCHAIDSPRQPEVLYKLQSESYELNPFSKLTEAILKKFGSLEDKTSTAIPSTIIETLVPGEELEDKSTPYDEKLVNDILNGDHCLHGGSGWWKYEFCHGKKVDQYHVDASGSKTVNTLGIWNKENHILWLEQHPNKRTNNKNPKQVSQLYSNGDLCTDTLKPRQVEVQLRCKESSAHPNSVSTTLMEPSVCNYILTVESPIFCSILSKLDEYGTLQDRTEL